MTRIDPETVTSRRAARLAAVQALYQMEVAGSTAAMAINDLANGRLPGAEDGDLHIDADAALFRQIIETTVEKQTQLDTLLASRLARGWRLERIDAVARAILRAGIIELWRRPDVPTAVVIDEYVEIAHAFFDGPEPGFVNATLDACVDAVRAA